MTPIICEHCLDPFGSPSDYLQHVREEHYTFDDYTDQEQAQALEILAEELVDAYLDSCREEAEERLLSIIKNYGVLSDQLLEKGSN